MGALQTYAKIIAYSRCALKRPPLAAEAYAKFASLADLNNTSAYLCPKNTCTGQFQKLYLWQTQQARTLNIGILLNEI